MDNAIRERYAGLDGRALLEPFLRDFKGEAALVSSFGAESAVLLHMVASIDRTTPVIFIDTGKLFVETRQYRDTLVTRLGLSDIRTIRPAAGDLARLDPQGGLYKSHIDLCCDIRKTRPLAAALDGVRVVISGRKRFHGGERTGIDALSFADGRLKAEPLAAFSALDLASYMSKHDLPAHPLTARGYRSIGCAPCTAKGGSVDNPRAGRWAGHDKTECGIHWTEDGRMMRLGTASVTQPL